MGFEQQQPYTQQHKQSIDPYQTDFNTFNQHRVNRSESMSEINQIKQPLNQRLSDSKP